ncbi:aminotransferase-like domain-containing protein [Prosthecochloris sp. GSB1]|uniref:aminotransferase-like domain-containing protein n=1 Tax=Prosthecochloris sp. GSB1 TaxID=281093 RepID=UPI001F3164BB|nr:PLP-dependent aminotransferase family protein [Prosthecochloris sp. GSB1]
MESLGWFLAEKGLPVDRDRLIITTGSQQAISMLARVFLDPGDRVLVENPCFIGALAAFKACQAELTGMKMDHEGLVIEELERELFQPTLPKFLYITPAFHNPLGMLYSEQRKAEIAKALAGTTVALIEDDAYGDLYFYEDDKTRLRPIKGLSPEGVDVCYTGSFSKILGPGLRLGWLLAPKEIYEQCELSKQSLDACSSSFTQVLADEFIRSGLLSPYIERVREEYRRRAFLMCNLLETELPSEVSWQRPRGGFYIWLTLPGDVDATQVLQQSLERGVVFVVGKTFDPEGRRNHALRLSYCNAKPEEIERGVPVVAAAIRNMMNR